jgi:predicted transposase YbfD/YdcC
MPTLATSLEKFLEFEGVEDPRINRKKLYPLNEILFLCISAVISGFSEWEDISDFGNEKLSWLRGYLPYNNGIPSHDTVNRVMGLINYRDFEVFFISWVESLVSNLGGKVISIDGKKLRSSVDKLLQQKSKSEGGKSAVHLVEAWCSELNLCLGQYKTEDKSNEITAIPALLDMLDIKNCVITIDAMGCQKAIAEKIIDKGGDYIFGLKGNQESIHVATQALFEQQSGQTDLFFVEEAGHGRGEARQCRTLPASLLDASLSSQWKGLNTLIEIRSERYITAKDHYSMEYRYYLGSCEQSAELYNGQIREHWDIENGLHWTMDVTFGEDKSRKRAGNSAQNFGLIRRVGLNLLKNNKEKKRISINRRMHRCAMSDDYRAKTLNF